MTRLVSKSEFARECDVSPARVSQWINEGKISPDAIVGEGRRAKINADLAVQQVYSRRDVGQSLGNGKDTQLANDTTQHTPAAQAQPAPVQHAMKLEGEVPAPRPSASANGALDETKKDADAIQRFKRLKLEREAEDDLEERLLRRGEFMRTEDANAEMARIVTQIMRSFEGGLKQFAADLSSEFGVSGRDVQHTLMRSFRSVREGIHKRLEQDADMDADLEEPVDLVEREHGDIPGQSSPPSESSGGSGSDATTSGRLC
ncbi:MULTISPECIES: hypothetical protein [unclassified Pseudovibrio]|uniref:hypothetical protein n=1 Tax=unclassified Pseudovibrio TaxID=2627060 RepID=UPI0007AEABB3|nr:MULTISPECIES: hypothetical protein [unclassified Pseudovibrio]KZL02277.1 hypothetical protein PsW74_01375 [Pseudovibrio sp. W74]KZL08179.1 hypothetical protein PsAD14_03326 [Pseudovibrio sp. Ad14]